MFQELPLFQLRADEAIVAIGVTPPEAKFFSYTPYLMTRTYAPATTPDLVFASWGESINVNTIKTLGPGPFSRQVALIFTPDRNTEARVRAALRVFRITPSRGGALSPFPVQPRRVRGNGTSELAFAPDLERLRKSILDTYKDSYDYTEYHTKAAAYDGYEYIARRKNTLGDSPDALYYVAGYLPMWDLGNPEDDLTLGPNYFLVVYGPRHDATGKATYANINVYAS